MQTTDEFIVWKARITNQTDEPIPASTMRFNTRNGTVLSCSFGEIGPNSSGEAIIEGSVATTGFRTAKLLAAAVATVTFESEFGEAPASQTVVVNETITLPVLENDGDKEFLGWIEKGSESTEPLSGEYVVKEDITLVAVWKTAETPAPEAPNPDEEVTGEPEPGANDTAPTIPQTGDDQNMVPALCGLSAIALFAVGVLVAARRKFSVR